ncbi:MAG: glycosyl transferase family 1, partial [Candidatus Izimaplasma sp.]|nr:glycosyl transferase family 1 [Candidatus Izimaplasma bacterium]
NNFYYASLGNSYSIRKEDGLVYVSKEEIKKAAKQLLTYLFDLEKRNICVEQNFLKGKEFYSLNTLKELLKPLFEN